MKCMICFSTSPSRCMSWRCHDCFGDPVFCTHCVQQSHQLSPFHRVSRWDGKCFLPSSLSNAGLTLNLGHAGRLCPRYNHQGISGDTDLHWSSRNEQTITKARDELINGRCSSPETTVHGQLTQLLESATSTRKRTFSSIELSAEACDLSIPVHYNSHFWESRESGGCGEVSSSSQKHRSDTPTQIQPCVSSTTVPDIDTAQDPFFANDSEDEEDWKSLDKGGVPVRIKRDNKKYDDLQCPILTVVDTTGVHELRTRFCRCHPLTSNPLHTQLINMGLYPSSMERTRTVFTFRVLHHYDLTNLEGKTSAWQYYSTLRRLSSNVFPDVVVDRYRELMRALRQWRDLASRRRAGLPMEKERQLEPGGLALFCPACPQPGVNLPVNWKDDPEQYVPSFSSTSKHHSEIITISGGSLHVLSLATETSSKIILL